MGTVEIRFEEQVLLITSHLIVYGDAASQEVVTNMRDEIEAMWNDPAASILMRGVRYRVRFQISAELKQNITELEVLQNVDPRNNYFRVETYSFKNISFVDDIGSNTGYFQLDNLYQGSTTAAHEYGHTIGLIHPRNLDIRGQGVPGIMYPRGTIVDPQYQYDSTIPAGDKGGSLHPRFRKVRQSDIEDLALHKLDFENRRAILGEFTNVYHERHWQG